MADERTGCDVIDLAPRLKTLAEDGSPPPLVRKRTGACLHYRHTVEVDLPNRLLTCSKCGAELDPYDFLDHLARYGTRLVETRKRYQALAKRVERLLAEEKNVKARVKRWRQKERRQK